LAAASLYVAWQNQVTRAWHTVARLTRSEEGYELVFTRGVSSLLTIPADLFRMDVTKRYVSNALFPLFKNRLPSRNRADFQKMAEWLNVTGHEDEFGLLSKFGLIPGTDSLLVYPEPDVISGMYKLDFFLHGIRHMHPDAIQLCGALKGGERLLPLLDVQNPADPNAIVVRCVDQPVLLGYVPIFYAADLRQLLSQAQLADKAQLTVLRFNEDAPSQLKLLCRFACPVPHGFRALSSEAELMSVEEKAA
jgi:HIRAN domain